MPPWIGVKANGQEISDIYLFFITDACHPYEPFKCPGDGNCISIQYLCDGAPDCSDGYDEDMRLCTAGENVHFFLWETVLMVYITWALLGRVGQFKANRSLVLINNGSTAS